MAAVRVIREVIFEGSHYERGLQRGRRLKPTLQVPALPELPRGFVLECFHAAERLYPPAIEEFEGLVRGGDFDRDRLVAYYFARLESRLGGCTMFAVEPACCKDGRGPIAGRNYDWAVSDLQWCELHRYNSTQGQRRIGYTHHWAGCPDVLNEAGLYVAIASLPEEPVCEPGVQWNILVEMISECCRTVEQAVEVCAGAAHLRPMTYLLTDAGGHVAIVEATLTEVRVRRPLDGFVVAANTIQGGEPVRHREAERHGAVLPEPIVPGATKRRSRDTRRSQRRIERSCCLLRQGLPAVSMEAVRRILCDHEAPICTGDHREPDGAPWGTIWSGICRPADGQFAIAPGLPCRHDYQAFTFAR